MTQWRVLGLLLGGLAAMAGCQTVPPQPIDLSTTYEELHQRAADLASVERFAASLDAASGDDVFPFDPSDGITLREAQAIALAYNTHVLVARVEADGLLRVAEAAGRWDDPGLDLSGGRKRVEGGGGSRALTVENSIAASAQETTRSRAYTFERDVESSVDRSWISGASLSITIPTSGRLRAEKAARSAEYAGAVSRAAETEWRILADLHAAWLTWSAEKARIDLVDEYIDVTGRFAGVADALRQAGELDAGTARLFVIERDRKEALRASLAFRVDALRAQVLDIMGLLPSAPVTLVPQLVGAPMEVPGDEVLQEAAAAHQSVQRLRAEYEAVEARLRVELRKQYPDITLSPAYSDEADETAVVLGLGFPVPVWNANREAIAAAAAERDTARARVVGRYQQALSEMVRAKAAAESAAIRRGHMRERVVPLADEQLAEARALLDVGEINLIVVYEALTQSLAIKDEFLAATLEERLAEAALASLLTPRPLPAGEKETTP